MKPLSSSVALVGSIMATSIVLALSAGPAAARENIVITSPQQTELTRTQRVGYRDLDLATVQGERALTRRVSGAVQDVCFHDGEHPFVLNNCKRSAWNGARPQMASAIERARDSERLTHAELIAVPETNVFPLDAATGRSPSAAAVSSRTKS